ncbi:ribonuclease HII [Pseudolysobacter antarcticus]|uniref:Ribonuclease HII n=1 Tax=Pseudolysobacter antarcticus TaxID=2511995 RepID=A0A411HLT4_9GAMM|nr:ribonuclease HII [Pseudolysobacter antarcticus]QBB71486.1 ribonuclease HII [Pseudolysobacter antarcticus]
MTERAASTQDLLPNDALQWIAGVDEAGRGPLVGPVVVAAVILDPQRPIDGLADSKKLSAKRRDQLDVLIRSHAICFSVIIVSAAEIDEYNILQASLRGMTRALLAMSHLPTLALLDGNQIPRDLTIPARAIVGGDALEPAISAASILAKVTRDRLMVAMDALYPDYGFAKHKGYPVPEHFAALQRLGPCPEHRRSFAPVRRALERC